jgi:hypothetical protein
MLRVFDCCGSVKEYVSGFDGVLARASRDCPCGGRLKGHGRGYRWVVCLEGIFRVPIQRLVCRACGRTVWLLPRILRAFYQCARDLAERIRSLWNDALHAMRDVRDMLAAEHHGVELAVQSMYRWARLPAG